MMLLPAIDLTGEPTAWFFQELQFRRAEGWTRESILPELGPAGVWRGKASDVQRWNPLRAWPHHLPRGGFRARLLTWDGRAWQVARVVQPWT